jgi:hypothetical protein
MSNPVAATGPYALETGDYSHIFWLIGDRMQVIPALGSWPDVPMP